LLFRALGKPPWENAPFERGGNEFFNKITSVVAEYDRLYTFKSCKFY